MILKVSKFWKHTKDGITRQMKTVCTRKFAWLPVRVFQDKMVWLSFYYVTTNYERGPGGWWWRDAEIRTLERTL